MLKGNNHKEVYRGQIRKLSETLYEVGRFDKNLRGYRAVATSVDELPKHIKETLPDFLSGVREKDIEVTIKWRIYLDGHDPFPDIPYKSSGYIREGPTRRGVLTGLLASYNPRYLAAYNKWNGDDIVARVLPTNRITIKIKKKQPKEKKIKVKQLELMFD